MFFFNSKSINYEINGTSGLRTVTNLLKWHSHKSSTVGYSAEKNERNSRDSAIVQFTQGPYVTASVFRVSATVGFSVSSEIGNFILLKSIPCILILVGLFSLFEKCFVIIDSKLKL